MKTNDGRAGAALAVDEPAAAAAQKAEVKKEKQDKSVEKKKKKKKKKKKEEVKKEKGDAIGASAIAQMRAIYARMSDRGRADLTDGVALGKLLIAAKTKVEHGEWAEWMREHVGCCERHAQYCMRAALADAAGVIRPGMTFAEALDAYSRHLNGPGKPEHQNGKGMALPRPRRLNRGDFQKAVAGILEGDSVARVFDVRAEDPKALGPLVRGVVKENAKQFGKGLIVLLIRTAEAE